jgi:protein-arginine kinase activator protein McsA
LEHQLRRAIQKQEFERAANLRDRIRELRQQPTVNQE